MVNIMHTTTSVSRRLNILCTMNVQDYSVPYNNAVRSVICEDLHFTHTWEARAWPHHFTASHLLDMNSTMKRNMLSKC